MQNCDICRAQEEREELLRRVRGGAVPPHSAAQQAPDAPTGLRAQRGQPRDGSGARCDGEPRLFNGVHAPAVETAAASSANASQQGAALTARIQNRLICRGHDHWTIIAGRRQMWVKPQAHQADDTGSDPRLADDFRLDAVRSARDGHVIGWRRSPSILQGQLV